ncbi:hypothetical protein [Kitasatospora mediocidica]|uniref:hypothetical protein n=1 Tax=Kitasatospora mediocidica TaxID=58352 RepID=UPI0005621934|nr:hypothetical protein [Kitasatospora mediocidica]
MGIGGCIIAFALGAIVTFGVNWHVHGVNMDVVGVILMVAGLLGLVTYASIFRRRRVYGAGRIEEVVEERRYNDGL